MEIPLSQLLAKLQETLAGLKNPPVLTPCKAASVQDARGAIPHPRCESDGAVRLSGTHRAHPRRCCSGRNAPQSSPESDSFSWSCCSRAGAVPLDGREESAPGLMRGDALAGASRGGKPVPSRWMGAQRGGGGGMASRLLSPAAFHIPWGLFCP